ncbi:MAG: nucleotidyltransferase domain-containing protein [Promethearchaeota archaeon]|nr:MAG: nucleotidyltransferase domain-containing protein [Candidatus Lokiarchaeota archaeon]
MVKDKLLKKIEQDFNPIIETKDILGILLFGSYSKDKETSRSDIDICIVAPNDDPAELLSYILQKINTNLKHYDIRLFQELPLYIKIRVIQDGILIYSTNKYDLYEFFYFYRKLWNDQKHRQKISKEELLSI